MNQYLKTSYSGDGFTEALDDYLWNGSRDALIGHLIQNSEETDNKVLSYSSLILIQMMSEFSPALLSVMGVNYTRGFIIRENREKALKLQALAVERGCNRARSELAQLLGARGEIMQAISYQRECIKNEPDQTNRYLGGCHYHLGLNLLQLADPDEEEAAEHLTIATEKYGVEDAGKKLVEVYSDRGSKLFDASKALYYLKKAADKGDMSAVIQLGNVYADGDVNLEMQPDPARAIALWTPYADREKTDPTIAYNLGFLYTFGEETGDFKNDFRQGAHYLELAYQLWTYEDSQLAGQVGYAFYRSVDFDTALKWLTKAQNGGYYGFSDYLGRIYACGLSDVGIDTDKALQAYDKCFSLGSVNNGLFCYQYAELLVEKNRYCEAFDVSDYGLDHFNDVVFLYLKASLVASGKVAGRMSKSDAMKDLTTCIKYDTNKAECYYYIGLNALQNGFYQEALSNLTQSSKLGFADASMQLGYLYDRGCGSILRDQHKAYLWFSKAAEDGSERGRAEADCFHLVSHGLFKKTYSY